jgi:hypothetical protein
VGLERFRRGECNVKTEGGVVTNHLTLAVTRGPKREKERHSFSASRGVMALPPILILDFWPPLQENKFLFLPDIKLMVIFHRSYRKLIEQISNFLGFQVNLMVEEMEIKQIAIY